jgi:hypothetical protein
MSLADLLDLEAERCSGCEWYRKLSEEDQATFDGWVAAWKSKKITFRRIHDACEKYGYERSEKALRDHVNIHVLRAAA